MQIEDKKVVSLAYTLKDDDGNIVDKATNEDPFLYLHGANNIIPGLENALISKTAQDAFQITVAAKDGYGERDDALKQEVPKDMFGDIDDEHLYVGARFQAQANGGIQVVTIIELSDDTITLDGNHPMAGQTLHFDGEVLDIRDATDEELMHGHVHTGGGCGSGDCGSSSCDTGDCG